MGLLDGKNVLITGSSKGIGKGIALLFGKERANVVVNYVTSHNDALSVADEVKRYGSDAIAVKADVSNYNQVDTMVSECERVFGPVDILVNNAGIVGPVKPIHKLTETEWDEVMNINLKGVFLCIKRVLPEMLQRGSGRIVNISSVNAFTGENLISAYTASKGGVLSFTKNLSLELAPKGIYVNAICPGAVDTPMMRAMEKRYPGSIDGIIERTPAGRLAAPDDIARLALFLASDNTQFIHGQYVVIDGAITNNIW